MSYRWKRGMSFMPLVVVMVMMSSVGCRKEPTQWDDIQEETQGSQAPAVSEESVEGGDLNRFFPQVESPLDIVFKQEKDGFVQAALQQDGKEMAVLSISDTTGNPSAKEKFASSEQKLDDYPMAAAGSKGTSVLVADRYQVQIRSTDPAFGEPERVEWLGKFDLASLSNF